jgi:hypothetical protein
MLSGILTVGAFVLGDVESIEIQLLDSNSNQITK